MKYLNENLLLSDSEYKNILVENLEEYKLESDSFLHLDSQTITNLELFNNSKDASEEGTIIQLFSSELCILFNFLIIFLYFLFNYILFYFIIFFITFIFNFIFSLI